MGTNEAANPRAEPFDHICRRCSRCCRNKLIRLDPYEVARLARCKGLSTAEFSDVWTWRGTGVALRQTEEGACALLGENGCTVHPDRPLACRLYPLAHKAWRDGAERFTRVELEPDTLGEITANGTIAAYIDRQQAGPYLEASAKYFEFFCAAEAVLGETWPDDQEALTESSALGRDLFDMDTAIGQWCAERGKPEPQALEDRLELHLAILYAALGDITGHGQ